jgi:hypothetical protein
MTILLKGKVEPYVEGSEPISRAAAPGKHPKDRPASGVFRRGFS